MFPIRVDAWSADRTIRVVDTFLYDPSAPDEGLDPFQLAYQLLAEAEVMGMGRSARHYTNRVELYKPDLHHEVTRQIHAQTEAAKQRHHRQQQQQQQQHREAAEGRHAARKKRRDRDAAIAELTMAKKSKVESTTLPSEENSGSANTVKTIDENSSSTGDSAPARDSECSMEAEAPESVPSREVAAAGNNEIEPIMASREVVASTCKHVRLRLAAYGVRIHDDFYLDLTHDEDVDGMGPIRIAQRMGDDLNLPVELVQAIAIEILEQLHGREVLDDALMLAGGDDGQPPPEVLRDKDNVTAAWALDQRVHITNVAHLVSHHRPNASSSAGASSSSTQA